jgi:hypothetical protein
MLGLSADQDIGSVAPRSVSNVSREAPLAKFLVTYVGGRGGTLQVSEFISV